MAVDTGVLAFEPSAAQVSNGLFLITYRHNANFERIRTEHYMYIHTYIDKVSLLSPLDHIYKIDSHIEINFERLTLSIMPCR